MEGDGYALNGTVWGQGGVYGDSALNLFIVLEKGVCDLLDDGGVQRVGGHQDRPHPQSDHVLRLPGVGAGRDEAHGVAVVEAHQLIDGPPVGGDQPDVHFLSQLSHRVGGRTRRAEEGVQIAPFHGGGGFGKGQAADLQLIHGQAVGPEDVFRISGDAGVLRTDGDPFPCQIVYGGDAGLLGHHNLARLGV